MSTIEVLRLGTNVHTGHPVWPHIRKISIGHLATRYVFTGRAGRQGEAIVVKSDEPDLPTTVDITVTDITADEFTAQVEFLTADLEAYPYSVGPTHFTYTGPHALPAAATAATDPQNPTATIPVTADNRTGTNPAGPAV